MTRCSHRKADRWTFTAVHVMTPPRESDPTPLIGVRSGLDPIDNIHIPAIEWCKRCGRIRFPSAGPRTHWFPPKMNA